VKREADTAGGISPRYPVDIAPHDPVDIAPHDPVVVVPRDPVVVVPRDPVDVVARMLRGLFGEPRTHAARNDLAAFQLDALTRIESIVQRRGGAILADSVGLGKTHVAAALIRSAAATRRPVLVCGPASLAAHWRRHLQRVSGWRWCSHTSLSRGKVWTVPAGASGRALIVVDEAHAFRNPRARRYGALAALAADAEVLLITATPVNNSVMDLYHLVRLFARDDALGDVGVPDLLAAFRLAADADDARLVRAVVRAVMVRRTRSCITRHHGAVMSASTGPLRFPARERTRAVHYDLETRYPDLRAVLLDGLAALTFPAHAIHGDAVPVELLRIGLLKRLESSVAALRTSLERHHALLREFADAARGGLLFDARRERRRERHSRARSEANHQLSLTELMLGPWPPGLDRDALLRRADADCRHLSAMLGSIAGDDTEDPKLDALQRLVARELAGESIVIFAEYRDTAIVAWKRLLTLGGVALIHGSDARLGAARSSRRAVIDRFAPVANRARTPRTHERVRVLIATDVLSEGLNLQDARVVISYDVPWNPVRMAQRTGRIDRLGSPHASVLPCTFLPDRGVDALLGLMRTVRRKLRAIRLVSSDAPAPQRTSVIDAAHDDERLWLEHLRLNRDRAAPDTGDAPIAAAVHWDGPGRAALCCVACGDTTRFVLCRDGAAAWCDGAAAGCDGAPAGCDGAATELDPRDLDRILLRALHHPPARDPDIAWLRTAGEAAVRAVTAAARHAQAAGTTSRSARTAARAVHQWLDARPGGPSTTECAAADCALATLAAPLTAGEERQVARAVGRLKETGELAALLELAGKAPWAGSRDPPATRPFRVAAMLEFLPEASVRQVDPGVAPD
jgi:superfamily II DNA or RNA helicase